MTIARAQMYRQLYQMGGIGTLPMDFGQPLQVPQQPQPSFSSAQNITMNPLLNYGQPQLGGGTPLTMAGGGITRLGYQEGGMDQMMMEPQMQEQMMQPQMQEQMMQAPMQGQMMPQGSVDEQQGQNALLTIIQMLIEEGIDPETAKEIAGRILEAFDQGGTPAVEALASQLEQEEGMQQPMMMAEGGLTSIERARDMLQSRAPNGEFLAYINPQEAGILKLMGGLGKDINNTGVPSFLSLKTLGKVVTGGLSMASKTVSNAVSKIAKSPIGQIALAIAAPYAIGAMFPAFATLGGAGFMGAALRAGISNLAIQGITTGKFDPKQALIAGLAGGALQGLTTPASAGVNIDPSTGLPIDSITGTITQPSIPGSLQSNLGQGYQISGSSPNIPGTITQPSSFFSPTEYGSALSTPATAVGTYPSLGYEVSPTSPVVNVAAPQPNIFERGIASVQDFGTKLMSDPIGTIGSGIKSTYDLAKEYPTESILAATSVIGALSPQQPGEPDDSYQQRKAEHDAKVAQYITQYGGGAKVYSPSFYAMEGAVDPFAGRSTYAAMGGRIGYGFGDFVKKSGIVKEVDTPTSSQSVGNYEQRYRNLISANFIDENKNGIDDRQEYFSYGRIGQAKGSMPMGEPRRNPAGIMELDYRAKGGFVPPVGIKEKADDIPAMLSNNEFVFTANAVRNAGGGNVNKGAERMYGLMKQLEAGGVV